MSSKRKIPDTEIIDSENVYDFDVGPSASKIFQQLIT